jgi:hypothetical protein
VVPHTRKCLTNSKVRHDGTDKRDLNFDAYQDIQSQNDYSPTQLNVMGYRGDILRAQFCPDKISKRKASGLKTVANTRERQEALAAAHTHGKKFFCDRRQARDVGRHVYGGGVELAKSGGSGEGEG